MHYFSVDGFVCSRGDCLFVAKVDDVLLDWLHCYYYNSENIVDGKLILSLKWDYDHFSFKKQEKNNQKMEVSFKVFLFLCSNLLYFNLLFFSLPPEHNVSSFSINFHENPTILELYFWIMWSHVADEVTITNELESWKYFPGIKDF